MILPKLQLTGKTHVEPKQTQILELETADTYKKHLARDSRDPDRTQTDF